MSSYHEPVMGKEVLDLMCTAEDGLYLDGTVGGGGHTRTVSYTHLTLPTKA